MRNLTIRLAATRPPTAAKHKTNSIVLIPITTWPACVLSGTLCPANPTGGPEDPVKGNAGGPVGLFADVNPAAGLINVEVGDKDPADERIELGIRTPGGGPVAPTGGVKPGGGPEKPAGDP